MPPVISIVGHSGSGKTTLIEKLIPELKKKGYRIAVIKHAVHGFDADMKGKDSRRHKDAGADTVIVSSAAEVAIFKTSDENPADRLDDLLMYCRDADLVITEGYKREKTPKIEIFRRNENKKPLFTGNKNFKALVTDAEDMPMDVPVFRLDDVKRLADWIEKIFL